MPDYSILEKFQISASASRKAQAAYDQAMKSMKVLFESIETETDLRKREIMRLSLHTNIDEYIDEISLFHDIWRK